MDKGLFETGKFQTSLLNTSVIKQDICQSGCFDIQEALFLQTLVHFFLIIRPTGMFSLLVLLQLLSRNNATFMEVKGNMQ